MIFIKINIGKPALSLTYMVYFLYNIFIEDMQRKERSFMEDADPEGETNHYLNKIRKPFKGIAC